MAYRTFELIMSDKPFTVRVPWMAMPDAVALYQAANLANEHEWFSDDWFDDNGEWPHAHEWR